jgi:hypothetical protein
MTFPNGLPPKPQDSDTILAAKWLELLRGQSAAPSAATAYQSGDSLTRIYYKIALFLNGN